MLSLSFIKKEVKPFPKGGGGGGGKSWAPTLQGGLGLSYLRLVDYQKKMLRCFPFEADEKKVVKISI